MRWHYPIYDIYEAHLRAERAETLGWWHVVVQQSLYCLERSQNAQDSQAIRFFATKLSHAYRAMHMPQKATFYTHLAVA
jgi:hypothetical protein